MQCVKFLRDRGRNVELHIIGIGNLPEEIGRLDYIVDHGFLNKNVEADYNRFINIVASCHIFILPTRAECAGIVFAEASAYGLPILTYDTGGISDYVQNGINGYRLPLTCDGKDFALKIEEILTNGTFGNLRDGGRKLYEEKLNWKHWGDRFENVIKKVLCTTLF